jgi:hypothetical protein
MRHALLHGVLRAALIAYGLSRVLCGQTFVTPQPDCNIFFSFTATGTLPLSPNAGYDNRTNGCIVWQVTSNNSGFSAINLVLQSAPNNAGVPGTWVTYAGATAIAGANPITSTTQTYFTLVGYNPWVRINLSSKTGSGVVSGSALGWRSLEAAGAAGVVVITTPSNVNVADWGGAATSLGQKAMAASVPVTWASDQAGTISSNIAQVNGHTVVEAGLSGTLGVGGGAATGAAPNSNPIPAGELDSAGNLITPDYCTLKATVSGATLITGNTQLVAVSGSKTIRVCKWSFTTDTLTTAQLVTGTGATCTSSTAETGVYSGAGGGLFGVIEDYQSPLITTAAKTLCLALSAGVTTTGGITILYSQR